MELFLTSVLGCVLVLWVGGSLAVEHTEEELTAYLSGPYEKEASRICRELNVASWNSDTDLENETKTEELNNLLLKAADFDVYQWKKYFKDANYREFTDPKVKRQLEILSKLGTSALKKKPLEQLLESKANMNRVYSTAKICPFKKQNCNLTLEGLSLDPDIENLMAQSTDYDELAYVWTAWHDASGSHMKQDYVIYVNISNEAAKLNDYDDMGEMWRSAFESDTFIEDIDKLWNQVKPLYVQLHTYVRHKLEARYGDKMNVGPDGLMPAHIFGNMWAQTWKNLYQYLRPYPDASPIDIDKTLQEQNYTVLKMFETADKFYESLGLASNAMSYDETKGAIITKPEDKQIVCHASAWDFCDSKDFRIKMCTKINGEDFITIHHEMGHIQYFIQYKDLPLTFRTGANPGFHEAIGDTIALSVSTPEHLERIGLVSNYIDSQEDNLNALMSLALEKVAFLPFGVLIDKWRWDVFSGKVNEKNWNAHWWELRGIYQLMKAPVERTENDFDPGAKYHVAADSQYISYFVAHILQFQFHKALCIEAKQYDPEDKGPNARPLHKCDIYRSTAAGQKLKLGLQAGGSQNWNETLFLMTGSWKMNGSALLEYFQPLQEYLEAENAQYEPGQRNSTIIALAVLATFILAVVVMYFVIKHNKNENIYEMN